MTMQTVKTFNKELTINGKTLVAKIVVKVCQDELDNSMLPEMTDDEAAEYRGKIESGELYHAIIVLEGSLFGLTAFDSLGGVDLRLGHIYEDIDTTIDDHDMVQHVINDLEIEIRAMATALKGLE